ncbi:MAG: hypothetical protein JNK64_00895 [Myxococcales bacterium]|nr:hypothetical protein [Myxococcales bacterium]
MIRTLDDAERLFEHVLQHLHPSLAPAQHADILEMLYWACDDPGDLLLSVRENWLRADDRYRVEVALAFDETFPCRELSEMEAAFRQIVARWPDLAGRCEALVVSRVEHERRSKL